MPYARKRKRVYRRRPRSKRTKRRYSSRFRRRRSTLSKAFASRRRYRNRKLVAQYRPGTLSFGNRYIRDTKRAWLHWNSQLDETLIAATNSSSPLEVQFGDIVNTTSALFNGKDSKTGADDKFSENWDVYSSLYQQAYVKHCNVTVDFSSMDNRVFSIDPQVTTSTLNPTVYIVGIAVFRAPIFNTINPSYKWETLRKMGNVVYKKYTAGVTRSLSVTAKINLSKCLQQYDFALRCHQVMPLASVLNAPVETYAKCKPQENRCWCYPFVVPLVKSAAEGAAYTINYKTKISKLVCYSRPQSELAVIRAAVPNTSNTQLYPPIGTLFDTGYRPIPVDPGGDESLPPLNPIDIAQNDRLDDLEGNDNVQDLSIADNEAAILSVDQSLNTHIQQQFPNVH